ncbi:MAG: 4Fe-4S dicluster domain-containing protein [Deltaproteobacteria bacterium]|jgi:heterodisulfide reductase subunit C/nitrate reductase gamma subunit|nr:4Fe-4S dicluster domain-containing protein [Deltaproteobacteria bacterium]
MFYDITLYIALVIFGLGLVYKISGWFRYKIGMDAVEIPASTRVYAAIKGIISTLFSMKVFTLLRVFVLDVILQIRILREDFLRWFMHMCIFGGFMLLLLMHALDNFITSPLFTDYYSTLNPFMFLRDLFGALVILGLGLALYRRFILKVPRLTTTARDHYAIIILAVIMISGIFLEGSKIVSYSTYQEMVEDYGVLEGKKEFRSLEAFWVEEFETVSPDLKGPFDAKTLELGKELHEMSCVDCHSRPQWAFMGYGIAKAMKPVALSLDRANISALLWYIHFLACFIALAYLPFSKFFHILASPLSLLVNAVMEKGESDRANIATKQAIELDACTGCGTCSLRCSVAVVLEEIPNVNILPSEKMVSLKALASGKELSAKELRMIQEGAYLCTNCKRCTVVCPVGINLQDLWVNLQEYLVQQGYPEPVVWAREAIGTEFNPVDMQDKVLSLIPADTGLQSGATLSAEVNTFSVCFGCKNCTTVCPVVGNYDNPQEVLGLLPHQIMHSVGLGLTDLALGSRMLWDCVTCYQCQEHCPQGVCVTDLFYELKNLAFRHLNKKTSL